VVREGTSQYSIALSGEHQRLNAAVAIATVEVLKEAVPAPNEAIARGLKSIDWPARFQVLKRGAQTIVLDGAHNPSGADVLAKTLRAEFKDAPLAFIVGVLEDKNWQAIVTTFAQIARLMVCVPVTSKRTALPVTLAHAAGQANPTLLVHSAASLAEALSLVRAKSHLVIAGSLYLVGEALELLGQNTASGERALNEWSVTRPPDAPPR